MKKVFRRLWIFCLVSVLMLSSFSVVCFAETDIDQAAFQRTSYYRESDGEFFNRTIGVLGIINQNGERVNVVFSPLAPQENNGILSLYSVENGDNLYFPMDWRGQVNGYSLYLYEAQSDQGEAEGFRPVGTISEGESVAWVGYNVDDGYYGFYTVCTNAGVHPEFERMPSEEECPVFVVNSKGEPAAYIGKEGSFALAALFEGSDSSPAQNNTPARQEPISNDPIEIPSKEKLFAKAKGAAIDRNEGRNKMILIGAGAAVAVAALAVVFVILKNKKAETDNEWIEEAEEGTELADDRTVSRLRMSSGQVIWVRQSVTIGRSKENDVVTNSKDTRVSSRHCRVVSQNGVLFVQDLRSTNGTFVDGKRLQPGQSVALSPGAVVGLGVAKGGEAFTVL